MTSDGSIELRDPVELPEVLDLLVVGGGPVGTAAAFHAKELGLACLVIDYDDLMARIRDYANDKLIYPSYGGGDNMKFPKGGDLVDMLRFLPLDKDEMFRQWKALYSQNSIPARVGVELIDLDRGSQGEWWAKCWNHNVKEEVSIGAHHVVLGFGRGVPRRLDIPGPVAGLAFRLSDSAVYVGAPVCVIGGGTSAAEAVIEISNAKVAAGDASKVCWSYRGDKMPKVSRALAEVFFDAYVGNGNIRYLPNSNPVEVSTNGFEKLVIRTDEVGPDGRPLESRPLEFSKKMCIACIGSDVPEKLLGSLGISLVTGGKMNKKRMVVSPLLETILPNVYMAGDMLSPVYLEADDFTADPSTFREIKRRGNIKAALRDGVFITEVIAQKLAGKTDVAVELQFADDLEEAETPAPVAAAAADPRPAAAAPADEDPVPTIVMTTGSQAPAAPPTAAAPESSGLILVRVLPGGDEADEFPVAANGDTTIGSGDCDVRFPNDTTLESAHAAIVHSAFGCEIRDTSAGTGVYLQLAEGKRRVEPGTILRAGQQWLVCGSVDEPGSLLQFDKRGKKVGSYDIGPDTVVVGRQAPDINLDPRDLNLSRRHLSMSRANDHMLVRDLKSKGGTFVRVDGSAPISVGDSFILGQQKLVLAEADGGAQQSSVRVDAARSQVLDASRITVSDLPLQVPGAGFQVKAAAAAMIDKALSQPQIELPPGLESPPAAAEEAAPAPFGPVVTFEDLGLTFTAKPGQTLCDVAEDNGIEIVADCHAGVCGSDPLCILSGYENLNEMDDDERDALEDICSLDPATHRLACMTRINGPVEVNIIEE